MQSSCPQPALDIAQGSFVVAYNVWLLEQRRFVGARNAWLLEQGRFVGVYNAWLLEQGRFVVPYNGSLLRRHPGTPAAVGSDVAFWSGSGGFTDEAADGAAIFQLHPTKAQRWLDGGEK